MTRIEEYFQTIKQEVENGADINDAKASYLHDFLDVYYTCIYEAERRSNQEEYDELPFSKVLMLPLAEREWGILGALEWFRKNGADFNVGEDDEVPLMRSVGNADAYMTEYLICHGANPDVDEDNGVYKANTFLVSLDVGLLNESFVNLPDKTFFDAALKTAAVLAKNGVKGRLHCIEIDEKTRTVFVNQAKVRF